MFARKTSPMYPRAASRDGTVDYGPSTSNDLSNSVTGWNELNRTTDFLTLVFDIATASMDGMFDNGPSDLAQLSCLIKVRGGTNEIGPSTFSLVFSHCQW